jgi:hypothetical protein
VTTYNFGPKKENKMGDKELLLEVISDVEKEIKKIVNGGGKWYDIAGKIAEVASAQAEIVAGIDWSGKDKKKFSMDVAEAIWFKYANLKRVPDFVERPLVRFILDKAIEAFVALQNRLGKWQHKTS